MLLQWNISSVVAALTFHTDFTLSLFGGQCIWDIYRDRYRIRTQPWVLTTRPQSDRRFHHGDIDREKELQINLLMQDVAVKLQPYIEDSQS